MYNHVCNSDNHLIGDINWDESLNVLDIVALANMVLSGGCHECGDVDGNGSCNVLDIVTLVNWVLFPED